MPALCQAAVLLASDGALDADLWALVSQVALLVLPHLLVPDLLVVVGVGRDPPVGAVAVVELLVARPQDAHLIQPRKRRCSTPAGTQVRSCEARINWAPR